jgi:hypothetical protein
VLQGLTGTEYPTQIVAALTAVLGLFAIALGYFTYRRREWAAWVLVGFSIFDAVSRVWAGHTGYLIPILLFAFAFNAGFQLHKEKWAAVTPSN